MQSLPQLNWKLISNLLWCSAQCTVVLDHSSASGNRLSSQSHSFVFESEWRTACGAKARDRAALCVDRQSVEAAVAGLTHSRAINRNSIHTDGDNLPNHPAFGAPATLLSMRSQIQKAHTMGASCCVVLVAIAAAESK